MNRPNWKWPESNIGFHFPDDLPERQLQHLDFIERAMGPKAIRAVPALLAAGISPYRIDQLNEITRLCRLLDVNSERVAACFGYVNERHLFETALEPEYKPIVYPSTAAGLCVFRLMTGVPLPELRVSRTGCEMRAAGVLDI